MAEPLVLADDSRPGRERIRVFTGFVRSVAAYDAPDIVPALAALETATRSGLFAAEYLSYELG